MGGRLLKYSYQAGRVSQWVASKLQSSIAKNMVFPSCSDIPIKVLIGMDHPELAAIPAAFPTAGSPFYPSIPHKKQSLTKYKIIKEQSSQKQKPFQVIPVCTQSYSFWDTAHVCMGMADILYSTHLDKH